MRLVCIEPNQNVHWEGLGMKLVCIAQSKCTLKWSGYEASVY